jgi:ubiquinol-cytochrome c reductase cytochrome c subunit
VLVLGHATGVWGWAPPLLALIAVLAVAGRARGVRTRWLTIVSAATLLAALSPPIADLADRGVALHMVQHLLLLLIAAPALGTALAYGRRRRGSGGRRIQRWAVTPVHAPLLAGAVHLAITLAWHVPLLYDLALRQPLAHAAEHSTMWITGVWWWMTMVHRGRRGAPGTVILSAFIVATGGALLGAVMMFARVPLYAHGDVVDQQIAGALMAGAMGAALPLLGAIALTTSLRGATAQRSLASTGRWFAAAAMVLVMVAASAPAEARQEPLGEDLYRRDCLACHGAAGEGTRRGPAVTDSGEAEWYYYLSTGRMPITSPDAPVRRSPTPYTEGEIEALLDYAREIGEGPELPSPSGAADLSRGAELYRMECAACHGAEGAGGALAIRGFAPPVHQATRLEVVAAVTAGPGDMPQFSSALTPDDVAAVAEYTVALGGLPGAERPLPAGRTGEGLVAGLLVAVIVAGARWIGKPS